MTIDVVANGPNLSRSIGFWGLLALSLGVNIGGALFALTTLAAGFSGPSLPLAMLMSATPVLLALVPFCLLSLAHPCTSASYRYTQILSPTLALVGLLASVCCMSLGGMPIFGLVVGPSLSSTLGLPPTIIGALIIALFYLINVLGLKLTAQIQLVLSMVLVSALMLFIVQGAPSINEHNLSPLFPNTISGTLVATGLLYTFCAGGLFVVELGGEVVDAKRTMPKALVVGMLCALFIYLGIMFVTIGVVHWSELKGRPLTNVASEFMSVSSLYYFTIGGALVAGITTINGVFALQSRLIMAASKDGLISNYFSTVHGKFGTPHRALGLIAVISIVALLIIPSIGFFASMLNFTMIVAVTLVSFAALKVIRDYPSLCDHSAFSLTLGSVKTICWAVISINILVIGFLAVRA